MARRLAAILAADVVGYSKLMAADEAGTLSALREHRRTLFDPETAKHGGRIVKLMGDGTLVEFSSVVSAVECALAIQQALAASSGPIRLRIGINLGDIIIEGDDIYGDGVNVAARLEALAEPGGICISSVVHESLGTRVDAEFSDDGEQTIKNIARPVRVWRWPATVSRQRHNLAVGVDNRLSIAVLPFDNMSGDPEQEYFSDGITEDIITDLARVSGLFVTARNSSFVYKGQATPIQRISADLGVSFVVEGSVRKSGQRVRVTAQLIDGRTGGHVWANRYDGDLTDVFAVQDDITRKIVEALKVALAPSEKRAIARVPTQNTAAYEYYLRGRHFLQGMTRDQLMRARDMFLEAVALDPDYALAFAGLADCEAHFYKYYSPDSRHIEAAINHGKRALELDPDIAEAHASLGFALALRGDDRESDQEIQTAIEIDSMLYEAYWFGGLIESDRGNFGGAAEQFRKASQVRGDDLQSKMMLMNALLGLERNAELEVVARETLEIATRQLSLNPGAPQAAYVGAFALIHLNDLAQARKWVDIAAKADRTDPRTTYNLACVYSILGEIDKALEFLKLAIRERRSIKTLDWARIDPDLELVRKDARFEDLLKLWSDGPPDDPALHAKK